MWATTRKAERVVQRISGTPGTMDDTTARELPATAAETTAENPWPLSLLSHKIKDYIDRMSVVWVEGQIIELNHRGKVSYLTLRDLNEEKSVPVQVFSNVLDRVDVPLAPGSHVVVQLKADFWVKAGRLTMRANAIRAVGLGELLARLERLAAMLRAEGLFDPAHKKPLPFIPNRIGLITGRDSDAEKDVVRNARLRWPAVEFDIINTAVQGTQAVGQIIEALEELDSRDSVDVIIIARGGGSLEDLLPFSNEALIRAVYHTTTPVVSAIGHEADRPILDDVADLRASTPTDAAKRTVPDFHEETMGILQARAQLDGAMARFFQREQTQLDAVRSRPVLANPMNLINHHQSDLDSWRQRAFTLGRTAVQKAQSEIEYLRTQVRALSPLNTLARGYAIVQDSQGVAIRNAAQTSPGETISVTVERGSFEATIARITSGSNGPDL